MNTCPKCGCAVPDGAKFCPECSYDMSEQTGVLQVNLDKQSGSDPQPPTNNANPYPPNQQQPNNYGNPYQPNQQPGGGYAPYQQQPSPAPSGSFQTNPTVLMVWSIINLICCCLPLGIVGLVFTLTAKNEPTPEAQQNKLKNAFICNIIATIVGIVVGIISFAMGLFSAL